MDINCKNNLMKSNNILNSDNNQKDKLTNNLNNNEDSKEVNHNDINILVEGSNSLYNNTKFIKPSQLSLTNYQNNTIKDNYDQFSKKSYNHPNNFRNCNNFEVNPNNTNSNSNNFTNYINNTINIPNLNNTNNNNDHQLINNNLLDSNTLNSINKIINNINSCKIIKKPLNNISTKNIQPLVSPIISNDKCGCSKISIGINILCGKQCGCKKNGGSCNSRCKCKDRCNNSSVGNDVLFFKLWRNKIIRNNIFRLMVPEKKLSHYEKLQLSIQKRKETQRKNSALKR